MKILFNCHGPGLSSDSVLIFSLVLLKKFKGRFLGRRQDVRLVEEMLDPQEDLLEGQGSSPVLLLIQDREAN